jgi:hypothetical protein
MFPPGYKYLQPNVMRLISLTRVMPLSIFFEPHKVKINASA